MLTVFAEEAKIFASLGQGASGYLLKKTPPARLIESIREAHDGGSPMSPEIARKVIRMFRELRPSATPLENDLSPHEVRLVQLFAEGYSYQAAAERLHVSINTVRNYIRSIYEKLHVHSKSEGISKLYRAGPHVMPRDTSACSCGSGQTSIDRAMGLGVLTARNRRGPPCRR